MNEMDMAVSIRHIQNGKSLLATASVTLGGCFAVQGIQVREGKNGVFVSMPQRKDVKGRYHDVCFPTTAEMRRAINAAVLGEYERTAPSRASVLDALREKTPEPGKSAVKVKNRDKGAR